MKRKTYPSNKTYSSKWLNKVRLPETSLLAQSAEWKIYLAWDDGPRLGTDDCLATFFSAGVAASFLFLGTAIKEMGSFGANQVTDANSKGFLIGNHSYSHWGDPSSAHPGAYQAVPPGQTDQAWIDDFHACDAEINGVLGGSQKRVFARLPTMNTWRNVPGVPPFNAGNSKRVANAIAGDGYKLYGWDTEFRPSYTAKNAFDDVMDIVNNKTTSKKPGKIIVLSHDYLFRTSQGTKQKLVDFVKMLQDQGIFAFETLATY